MIEITSADQLTVSDKPFVLKFGATWCGPCKRLQPILDKLAQEFPDVAMYSIDIDVVPELAKTYEVRSVPTLLFFKAGQLHKRQVGLTTPDMFRKVLTEIS